MAVVSVLADAVAGAVLVATVGGGMVVGVGAGAVLATDVLLVTVTGEGTGC